MSSEVKKPSPKRKLGIRNIPELLPSSRVQPTTFRFVTKSTPELTDVPSTNILQSAEKEAGLLNLPFREGLEYERSQLNFNQSQQQYVNPLQLDDFVKEEIPDMIEPSYEITRSSSEFHDGPVSDGVPSHLLLDHMNDFEHDRKPGTFLDYRRDPNTRSSYDAEAEFLQVKEEIYDGDAYSLSPDIPSTSNWDEGSIDNENDIYKADSKFNRSEKFRRMCTKCQQTITYERRNEWHTICDHALYHTMSKMFHCLLCNFHSANRHLMYRHLEQGHNFGKELLSHPTCDSPEDAALLTANIRECFPGAATQSLEVPEFLQDRTENRIVEHYLVTFQVIDNEDRNRMKLTRKCSMCQAVVAGDWMAKVQHALTHSDSRRYICNICSQPVDDITRFFLHSTSKHNGEAEMTMSSLDELSKSERRQMEELAYQLFPTPIPHVEPRIEEPPKPKKAVLNRVRCKKCKSYVTREWMAKCEHALLHTDMARMTCSECDKHFTSQDSFLFHTVSQHLGRAKLITRPISELNSNELMKVEDMVTRLFNDVETILRSQRSTTSATAPLINSKKFNPLDGPIGQMPLKSVFTRNGAMLDESVLERIQQHHQPKQPRILKKTRKRKSVGDEVPNGDAVPESKL